MHNGLYVLSWIYFLACFAVCFLLLHIDLHHKESPLRAFALLEIACMSHRWMMNRWFPRLR